MGVACVVLASAAVSPLATASSSSCPLASCVAGAVHARRTVTPTHALNAHNSWSDTGRVKDPTGMGLLFCGAGSNPSFHLGVVRRMCQRV